jgi:hypothetical protein
MKRVEIHDGAVRQVWELFNTGHLRHHCASTHVNEYPIRSESLRADAYLFCRLQSGVALVHGAVCHTSQPGLDAGSRRLRNRVFPGLDELHVNAHRAIVDDSEVDCSTSHVGRIRACHHSLRGCTAGVDTRAAEQFALNDRNFHPRPRQALGQERTSLTGSYDNRVVVFGAAASAKVLELKLRWTLHLDGAVRFERVGWMNRRRPLSTVG